MGAFEEIREAAPTISVGVLAADLLALGAEVERLEGTHAPLLHFDVMDGCFCPAMTLGPPLIGAVRTTLLKDVHLMIEEPLEKVAQYVSAGADVLTIHVEADREPRRVLEALAMMTNVNDPERGIVRGAALVPGTPVSALEPLLDQVELVLILAVAPGVAGQSFAAETPRRMEQARRMIDDSGRSILLGVDGGITRQNVAEVGALRPDLIVTGSAVFDGRTPAENARFMLESLAAVAAG